MVEKRDLVDEFLQASRAANQKQRRFRIIALVTVFAVITALAVIASLFGYTASQQSLDLKVASTRDARQASELQQQATELEVAATRDAQQASDLEAAATTESVRLMALSTSQAETERERNVAQSAESTAQADRAVAQKEATIARSREIAAVAMAQLDVNAERGLLLAMTAVETADTSQSEEALRKALLASRAQAELLGQASYGAQAVWSPDGTLIANKSASNAVQLWNAEDLEPVLALRSDYDEIASIAWSPDGKCLAASSYTGEVWLWDPDNSEVLDYITSSEGAANALTWSPDSQQLAVGGCAVWEESAPRCLEGDILVWNVLRNEKPILLGGHECAPLPFGCEVQALSWSPSGTYLAAGVADGTLQLWDTATFSRTVSLDLDSDIFSVAWSPDGRQLASLGLNGVVRIWNVETRGIEKTTVADSSGSVSNRAAKVAWKPDGKWLAFNGQDFGIRLWNLDTGQLILLTGHTNDILSLAWSPQGRQLASASGDGTVRLWDARESGDSVTVVSLGLGYPVNSVSWSSDGTELAFTYYALTLWDVDKMEWTTLREHPSHWAVAWNPVGTKLASDSSDNTIHILSPKEPEKTLVLQGHLDIVLDLDWSPDGNLLASVSRDHTARIWDTQTGAEVQILDPQITDSRGNASGSIAWSPNGRLLAFALQEPVIWVRDVQQGGSISIDLPGGNLVHDLAWSPDGHRVASAGDAAHVWDTTTGERLFSLADRYPRSFWVIDSVAWSPDGSQLACGYSDGSIRVWDVETRRSTITFTGHTGRVLSLAWSPDGRRLASGSQDFSARIYYTSIGDLVTMAQEQVPLQIRANGERKRRELTPEERYLYLAEPSQP